MGAVERLANAMADGPASFEYWDAVDKVLCFIPEDHKLEIQELLEESAVGWVSAAIHNSLNLMHTVDKATLPLLRPQPKSDKNDSADDLDESLPQQNGGDAVNTEISG